MTGLFSRRLSLCVVSACVVFMSGRASGADCNSNGVPDVQDIANGVSGDCNSNGVPDECDLTPLHFSVKASQRIPLGDSLSWLCLADLDGDQSLDVVTANNGSQQAPGTTLSILWNKEGNLELPSFLPVSRYPNSVSTGDLDGDANPDLIVVHSMYARYLTVIYNKGGREFESPVLLDVDALPSMATSADLDGDRDSDLVVSSWSSGEILILRNEGNRVFGAPMRYQVGWKYTLGDLDGDDDIDIVSDTDDSSNALVMLNQGDGTFAKPAEIPAGDIVHQTLLSDLDGEGLPEIVAVTSGGFSVIPNQGGGKFGEPETYEELAPLAAEDFDADGDADLAAVVYTDFRHAGVQVLVNDGSGILLEDQFLNVGYMPNPVLTGDLQGDSWSDLTFPSNFGTNGVLVSQNAGFGKFLEPQLHVHRYLLGSAISEDLNRDGHSDVAIVGYHFVAVLLNRGDGVLNLPVGYEAGGTHLIAGDLDGDQDLDLAVSSENGGVSVLLHRRDGAFGPRIDSGPQARLLWPTLGDFDVDGDLDIAAKQIGPPTPEWVVVLDNDGGGNFSEGRPVAGSNAAYSIAAADFDGDGRVDLALPNLSANKVGLYLNNKDVTFLPPRFSDVSEEPRAVTAADLDGDGSPDLAVGCWGGSDHTSSVISILLGHEGATFGKAGDFAVAPGPETIEAADFDGDGRADLLAPANFSPVATILLNRADRTISWDGTLPNGHAAISDLDGDGRKDLVLAGSVGSDHAYSALLNIYLNTTGTDLNGDGVLDDCAKTVFHRGDADGNGQLELTDAVFLVEFLFQGKSSPACIESADADNSGRLEITDAILLLRFLFQAGPPPAEPGPAPSPCGIDPDMPGSLGDLGCADYSGCG